MARLDVRNAQSVDLETQVMRDVSDNLDCIAHDADALRRVVRYVADRFDFIVDLDD